MQTFESFKQSNLRFVKCPICGSSLKKSYDEFKCIDLDCTLTLSNIEIDKILLDAYNVCKRNGGK